MKSSWLLMPTELLDYSTQEQKMNRIMSEVQKSSWFETRSLLFDEVASSNWIQGPEWLKEAIVLIEYNHHPAKVGYGCQFLVNKEKVAAIDWERFSQFRRLRQRAAWILTNNRKRCQLTVLLGKAEAVVWTFIQPENYAKKVKDLHSDKPVASEKLFPDGVMRAKRRLVKLKISKNKAPNCSTQQVRSCRSAFEPSAQSFAPRRCWVYS